MRTLLLVASLLGYLALSAPTIAADDAATNASSETAPASAPAAVATDAAKGCAEAGCPGAAGGCCTGKTAAATGEPKHAGCGCGAKAREPKVEP